MAAALAKMVAATPAFLHLYFASNFRVAASSSGVGCLLLNGISHKLSVRNGWAAPEMLRNKMYDLRKHTAALFTLSSKWSHLKCGHELVIIHFLFEGATNGRGQQTQDNFVICYKYPFMSDPLQL